jgi:hypothetical protein
VGTEIFNDLCTALAEQRLAFATSRKMSGLSSSSSQDETEEQREEREVAEIMAERNSLEDEAPALIKNFPLANALARTVTHTYNAATGSGSGAASSSSGTQGQLLEDFKLTKMDVQDFTAACALDDVLIRAIQLRPRRRMMDFMATKRAGEGGRPHVSCSVL